MAVNELSLRAQPEDKVCIASQLPLSGFDLYSLLYKVSIFCCY